MHGIGTGPYPSQPDGRGREVRPCRRVGLKGRDVVLWFDADEAGEKATAALRARIAKAGARSIGIVRPPAGVPKGWGIDDLEDQEAAGDDVEALIAAALNNADPGRNTDLVELQANEDAIALVFAARHADTLRYCHDWGMWLRWNGARWERERRRLAFHFARETAREANWEGKATPAKASTAAGVERFAQAARDWRRSSDEWDGDPWKLGTPGGTVDLRTGELLKHYSVAFWRECRKMSKLGCIESARRRAVDS